MKQSVSPTVLPLMQSHITKWENCRLCELCDNRHFPAFFRGRVPCNVLFIGDYPGDEDTMTGVPFHPRSQNGEILESIIQETVEAANYGPKQKIDKIWSLQPLITTSPLTWAATNLTACPSEGSPPENTIQSCQPRLEEFIALCRPQLKLIVAVGKMAEKYITKHCHNKQTKMTVIPHPSWIVKQEDIDLEIKKVVLNLREVLKCL